MGNVIKLAFNMPEESRRILEIVSGRTAIRVEVQLTNEELDIDSEAIGHFNAIIESLTPNERKTSAAQPLFAMWFVTAGEMPKGMLRGQFHVVLDPEGEFITDIPFGMNCPPDDFIEDFIRAKEDDWKLSEDDDHWKSLDPRQVLLKIDDLVEHKEEPRKCLRQESVIAS